MIICQGLKSMQQHEFESAISFFTKAAQKQAKKRDPHLLRALSIVEYTVSKPREPKTKMQMLRDAKKDLNRAREQSPKDETVLFLRGILNFALHRFYDAICDFERVIDKSEDTSAEHYLARGRCYACLSMFKEAITDLSIAINLNKDLLDAYLNRGKCAYLIGDTGLAFMDF
jgi:tetratricopeptide (TPR) repeat protein